MLFLVQNMKFSSSEDIEASAEAVFAALCDHAEFQQQMRRSGVSVVRMDELSKIGPGMSWEIDFKFRGP
jgi:carbon monoxide dehydrogenase subunit G|tara:strand:- start:265 stop:471 length:207 start_codon:yes stop_codon:yes gene_type:complete